MKLEDRFKEARLARGLSQTAAGKELGVTFATVLDWEHGRRITDRVRSHLELWISENRHERKVR